MDFYRTLAQKIAENLLIHVDGKLSVDKCRASYTVSDNIPSFCSTLNLTEYNFPSDFSLSESQCEFSTVLANEFPQFTSLSWSKIVQSVDKLQTRRDGNQSLYLCCVCGEAFSSTDEFDEHELNNHPNVCCSYIEIDFVKNIPSHVLSWNQQSPQGILRSCSVPPSLSKLAQNSQGIKCTKCNQSFTVAGQLHQHIIDCAAYECTPNMSVSSEKSTTASQTCLHKTTRGKKRKPSQKNASKKKPCSTRISGKSRKCDAAVQVCLGNKLLAKRVSTNEGKMEAEEEDSRNDDIEDLDVPKRYSCSKCCKQFMFLATLKKHQLSCNKLYHRRKRHNSILKTHPNVKGKNKSKNLKQQKSMNGGNYGEVKRKRKKELHALLESQENHVESYSDVDYVSDSLLSEPEEKSTGKSLITPEHKCPNCKRSFAYLANFKKHLKNKCLAKEETVNNLSDSSAEIVQEDTKPVEEEDFGKGKEVVKVENDEDDTVEMDQNETTDASADHQSVKNLEVDENNTPQKDNSKLDLWRIKQEHPLYAFKGSPAQHHSCPYCQRGFTYLANYRKHINGICPVRQQIDNSKSKLLDTKETSNVKEVEAVTDGALPESVKLPNLKLSVKHRQPNEISQSLLKLPTNRESPTEKGASNSTAREKSTSSGEVETQKFRTFSCNICHRIYLSHVKMLRHMLSHKLAEGTANAIEDATDQSNEKTIAKLALQRQTDESEKRKLASSSRKKNQTTRQSAIPCASLLENLARGGSQENGDRYLDDEGETGKNGVSLLIPAKKTDDKSSVQGKSEEGSQDNKYFIVVRDEADLESLTPELLDNLKAQLVANPESGETADEDEVVISMNASDTDSGDVWITFTTDENENNEETSAFIQLPRPMSL